VAKTLERGDEPNIRTTLQRLEVRGIAERLEGVTHQLAARAALLAKHFCLSPVRQDRVRQVG
jgi:hypothetical protein